MKQILFLACITVLSCSSPNPKAVTQTTNFNENAPAAEATKPDSLIVLELNNEVLQMLQDKNMLAVSKLAHPKKGVLFSPYSHIDLNSDKVFTPLEISDFFNIDSLVMWGYFDGSGDSMLLSTSDYYEKFIYDADFKKAEEKSFQRIVESGNTLVNIGNIFNKGFFVDNYFSGFKPEYGGMDWRALRLVFEKYQNQFYLVAIAHGSWTI